MGAHSVLSFFCSENWLVKYTELSLRGNDASHQNKLKTSEV
jgi:hypothetical protein